MKVASEIACERTKPKAKKLPPRAIRCCRPPSTSGPCGDSSREEASGFAGEFISHGELGSSIPRSDNSFRTRPSVMEGSAAIRGKNLASYVCSPMTYVAVMPTQPATTQDPATVCCGDPTPGDHEPAKHEQRQSNRT